MIRSVIITLGLAMAMSVSGCGDSCESLQADMEQIGKEIEKNPETAFGRAKELQELGAKYTELGCTGRP